jgi:hypothetical protein
LGVARVVGGPLQRRHSGRKRGRGLRRLGFPPPTMREGTRSSKIAPREGCKSP